MPPPAACEVDFDRDVRPIFEGTCWRCHGPEKPKSKFRLDNRESALKGGAHGLDIIPGQSGESPLIHYVARLVEDMEMPPPGKGEPLAGEQIALLRAWIDQGAPWSKTGGAAVPSTLFSVSPTLQWVSVSGNERKFREHFWQREGWAGGAQSFRLEKRLGEGQKLGAEGRILLGQYDYRVQLRLDKEDVGFGQVGFEQFRRYYDDGGGFHRNLSPAPFRLNEDLFLDTGKAWVDVGLTLPNWPRLVLGYEHQYKDGFKSTLQWGDAGPAPPSADPLNTDARKIYPAWKEIDERSHILKFDLSHTVRGINVEDNFRAEFYDLETRRNNVDFHNSATGATEKYVRVKDDEDHFQAANSLRLEKQLVDWLFLSGGYLYSQMDGSAAFNLSPLSPAGTLAFDDKYWFSNAILLDQETHVFNLNSFLGPWEGLSLSAGLQNEWMWQRGFGDVRLDEGIPGSPLTFTEAPAIIGSDLDKASVEEHFGLRYTRIPFTVLFAEGRLQQESIGQVEQQSAGHHAFLRDTDASSDLKEARVGGTISPWTRVSVTAHYKHREKQSAYDHRIDQHPGSGYPDFNNGYSAFIRSREIATDEFMTKLVVRPAAWVKTTLSYQQVASDYITATDPFTDFGPAAISPGGSILAGNYDAHIYSANAAFTPWRRLYLSGTFSYRDTRTETAQNGVPSVVPYRGDLFSVLSSTSYVLNQATDLNASYYYSWADYGQENFAAGLPLGLTYGWHVASVGVTRRLKKNITTLLQYRFYAYDEPGRGGANDYTAHAVLASLSMILP
ncbi:MAG: hypothetical protein HY674_07605 [Chloroflexi bacterium]|nr:hypothetical protein [Chloroflexota bacterium]